MVGIPGKSKGCNTCRRRKIKCDEERPVCHKCVKSKRVCEGYARQAVFINRSQDGLQKRRHLEEVWTLNPNKELSSEPCSPKLRHISSASVDMQAYIACFMGSLLPRQSYGPTTWTSVESYHQCFTLPDPSPVLRGISQAMALTRFGRHVANEDIYLRGREMYAESLRLLQQAIQNPILSVSDDTLLAIRLMISYESFEATTADSTAWHNHMIGLASIIRARGPAKNASTIARAVSEDIKHGIMIHCLTIRKRCPLSGLSKQRCSDFGCEFNHGHGITALGFDMAALLEDSDKLAKEADPSLQSLEQHLYDLLDMYERLDIFATRLFQRQGSDTKCEVCEVDPIGAFHATEHSNMDSPEDRMTPCDFFLHLSAAYGLMVTLAAAIRGVHTKVQHFANSYPALRRRMNLHAASGPRHTFLAAQILDMAQHYLHPELGFLFYRSSMLPLQCARWAVLKNPPLLAKCMSLIEELYAQRHIPFAKAVNIGQEHVSHFAKQALACH